MGSTVFCFLNIALSNTTNTELVMERKRGERGERERGERERGEERRESY